MALCRGALRLPGGVLAATGGCSRRVPLAGPCFVGAATRGPLQTPAPADDRGPISALSFMVLFAAPRASEEVPASSAIGIFGLRPPMIRDLAYRVALQQLPGIHGNLPASPC